MFTVHKLVTTSESVLLPPLTAAIDCICVIPNMSLDLVVYQCTKMAVKTPQQLMVLITLWYFVVCFFFLVRCFVSYLPNDCWFHVQNYIASVHCTAVCLKSGQELIRYGSIRITVYSMSILDFRNNWWINPYNTSCMHHLFIAKLLLYAVIVHNGKQAVCYISSYTHHCLYALCVHTEIQMSNRNLLIQVCMVYFIIQLPTIYIYMHFTHAVVS